jgi:glycosyltransferase involved in cell wall biosynthesis
MDKKPLVSVAVPTHFMKAGAHFFTRLLDSLWMQNFQDFEIVVTDNSDDDVIKDLCDFYQGGIRYFRNPKKGMAPNTNEAIRRSEGDLIKILYMDDFLAHSNSLQNIVNNFKGHWLVTGCMHTGNGVDRFNQHFPDYHPKIHLGQNTIGSPSVLTIKNDKPLFFDEGLSWLLDGVYYKMMYDKYGEPTILNDLNVVIGLHQGQMTNIMGEEIKLKELEYVTEKYG